MTDRESLVRITAEAVAIHGMDCSCKATSATTHPCPANRRDFQAWLRALGAAEATIRACSVDVQQHLEWLTARGMAPCEVGPSCLKEYVLHLVNDGHEIRPGRIGTYAPTTVSRKIASLRKFYSLLEESGCIPLSPVRRVRLSVYVESRSDRKQISDGILVRLLRTPQDNSFKGIRDRALIALMGWGGLMVRDVHDANLDDVNVKAGSIELSRLSAKPRIVLLSDPAKQMVARWVAVRKVLGEGDGALFISMHWTHGRSVPGKRISKRGIRVVVDSYLRLIGVKDAGISCQALRNSSRSNGHHPSAGIPLHPAVWNRIVCGQTKSDFRSDL